MLSTNACVPIPASAYILPSSCSKINVINSYCYGVRVRGSLLYNVHVEPTQLHMYVETCRAYTCICKHFLYTHWWLDGCHTYTKCIKKYLYSTYHKVSGVFWTIDPLPHLHPPSVSSPRTKGGGTHSPGGEGVGGSIFRKTPDIGLVSYSIITLPPPPHYSWFRYNYAKTTVTCAPDSPRRSKLPSRVLYLLKGFRQS